MSQSSTEQPASSESGPATYGPYIIAATGLGIIFLFIASVLIASTNASDRPLRFEFLMTGVAILFIGLNEVISTEYPRISFVIHTGLYLTGAFLVTVLALHLLGIRSLM